MQTGADKLHAILFRNGYGLENFRLLPGHSASITADEMLGEAARVIQSAIDGGCVHQPPVTGLVKRTI